MRSIVQSYLGPPSAAGDDHPASVISEDFQNWFGAVAQLGEHLLCKQRVVGSIPTGSTSFGLNGCVRTQRSDLKPTGIEAGLVFFENM